MHPDLPGHLNNTPFTLSLSPALFLCVSLSITFSLSISIITVWRTRCGLGLNVESCRLSHASHAEVHHGNKVCEERGGEKNKIHFTSYASHFHSLCAFNVWKRIAERMSRRKGWEKTDSYPCFASPVTLQCAWLITNSKNMHGPGVAFQIACTSECDFKGCFFYAVPLVMLWEYHIGIFNAGQKRAFCIVYGFGLQSVMYMDVVL